MVQTIKKHHTMRLSKLLELTQKAISKYGDLDVGFHNFEDARDIQDLSDCLGIWATLRILPGGVLPGKSVEDNQEEEKPRNPFAVIFYDW